MHPSSISAAIVSLTTVALPSTVIRNSKSNFCQAFSISYPSSVKKLKTKNRFSGRSGILVLHDTPANSLSLGIQHNLGPSFNSNILGADNCTSLTSESDGAAPLIESVVQQVKDVVADKKDEIKKKTGLLAPEIMNDIQRRSPHYMSDWTDGFQMKRKVIPAVLFLYFACLTPAVSFGTIASEITNGSIGVVEFLLSCGLSGMVRLQALKI